MFQLRRDALNQALEILAMAPEKQGIPSSEYIWIRGKNNKIKMSVASYVSSEATLEGEGEWPFEENFFLDRRTFVPWVMAARESKDKHRFQFHKKDDQLFISHGTRTSYFSNQSNIKGYGDLSKIKKHANHSIPVSKELREMLACGSNCAVADTIQPHLNGVMTMSNGTKVISYAASDYIFYIGKGKIEGKISEPIPFPLFLINLLTIEGLKKISCSGKYIFLQFKHGIVWQPVSSEMATKFPLDRIKTYSHQSKTIPVTFSTSSRRFSKMIVRLGYYMQSVRRRDWYVVIKGDRGKKEIRFKTAVPGVNFREKLSVNGRVERDFKIDWPLETLVPVFEFMSKHTKKMPLVTRINKRQGVSYVKAGEYWLAIPSKNV